MTDNKLWKIIQDIDWQGTCKDKKKRKHWKHVAKSIVEKYPEHILELIYFTKKERESLIGFLSSYNIRTRGSDSGWDLTAHIVGCGKKYVEEVKQKVIDGEYSDANIYKKIPYRKNFEYSFGTALERLIGTNY